MTGTVKERPILMAVPSVRAILAGKKTQTRRALTPQPIPNDRDDVWDWYGRPRAGLTVPRWLGAISPGPPVVHNLPSPYGHPGERLWVRENWRVRGGTTTDFEGESRFVSALDSLHGVPGTPARWLGRAGVIFHEADARDHGEELFGPQATHMNDVWARRNPLFLPRWAARLVLELTAVRVEWLHSISDADLLAEGMGCAEMDPHPFWHDEPPTETVNANGTHTLTQREKHAPEASALPPREEYAALWDHLHPKKGLRWEANPWCWALSFRVVDKQGGM